MQFFLFSSGFGARFSLLVVGVVILALIIDTSIVKIYYFSINQSFSFLRVILFIVLSCVCVICQFLILKIANEKSKEIRSKKELQIQTLHKLVTAVQYTSAAILTVVILEMIINSEYSILNLEIGIMISYLLAAISLGMLSHRFFLWFKSNRNFVIFIFASSSAMLAINLVFTFVNVEFILQDLPTSVKPHIGFVSPFFSGIFSSFLNYSYIISSLLSFMATWVATVTILSHYSKKLGRARYWIIISIPLFYFLIQFQPVFVALSSTLIQSDPVFFGILYTLFFNLSKPIGGILFGVAFFAMAMRLGSKNPVTSFVLLSGFGYILLFVSNQAIVLASAPYPPFGLNTIFFVGFSSYLILLGIYSVAISVAQDITLRQSIREVAFNESKLLDSIGMAQMEKQLQDTVLRMSKAQQGQMIEESGMPSALDDDEIKRYLHDVLEEIKKKREAA